VCVFPKMALQLKVESQAETNRKRRACFCVFVGVVEAA
jgi:hypothetical protein